MWPKQVDWKSILYGVEIEFVGDDARKIRIPRGWVMDLREHQLDDRGDASGAELQSPPLRWEERGQITEVLNILQHAGGRANWSCGLHVHVSLEAWGEEILLPMARQILRVQSAMAQLLDTAEHRRFYGPPLTEEMVRQFQSHPGREALRRRGRPQSHRCGINLASWYDHQTVEIRLANASLDAVQVANTVALCLRFVAAVGANGQLADEPSLLARVLGVPATGYPPAQPAPRWYREKRWLEEVLVPLLTPLLPAQLVGGEILEIVAGPGGMGALVETPDQRIQRVPFDVLPGAIRLNADDAT